MRGITFCLVFAVIISSLCFANTIQGNVTNIENPFWMDLYKNDNVNLTVGLYSSNILQNSNNCSFSYDNATFYQANGSSGNLYNFTISFINGTYLYFNCSNGTDYFLNWTVPYNQQGKFYLDFDYSPMQYIENEYEIVSWYVESDRSTIDFDSCDISIDSNDYSDVQSYTHTYSNSDNINLVYNCSYSGGWYNGSGYVSVEPYEPQFSVSNSNPFSGISSANGFKLGNYDIDLDGIDDLIVLEDDGLLVFDGVNVRANYSGAGEILNSVTLPATGVVMNNDAEFFITDFNWDGIGDILIGNKSDIHLLLGAIDGDGFRFNYGAQVVDGMDHILSFSAFDIDGDFYKDVLVLNATSADGGQWQYNYYSLDGDAFVPVNTKIVSGGNYKCTDMKIIDIDKDTIQDVICYYDVSAPNQIKLFHRNNLSMNISEWDYYYINANGFDVKSIFAGDYDSDGHIEIGVDSTDYGVYWYNYSGSGLELEESFDFGLNFLYETQLLDVMGDANYDLIYHAFKGSGVLGIYLVNSLTTKTFDWSPAYVSANYDFDNDSDSEIIYSYISGNRLLKIADNNISDFRNLSTEYTAKINVNKTSPIVNFTFSDINTVNGWNYNDYFFKVNMVGRTYRNDYYDSSQNLKYYLVDKSNLYTFNQNSDDSFAIDFAPNQYSMILADTITDETRCADYDLPFSLGIAIIASGCDYSGSVRKDFVANVEFDNVRVNINQVVFNASVNFSESNGTVSNSIFNGSSINISGTDLGVLRFENVSFINGVVFTGSSESEVKLEGCNLSGMTVNSFDGTIYDYGSNTKAIDFANRYVYNYSTISFLNSTGNPIQLSGSYSDSLGSSNIDLSKNVSGWFMTWDGTSVVLNFSFDTDFEYFNETVLMSIDSAVENITFIETHIPEWDYSKNNSHMTDFRNYTLLHDIDTVSNLKVSLVNSPFELSTFELNLTFNEPINLSDVDLSNLVSVGKDGYNQYWFNNSVANNFSYSFTTDLTNDYNASYGDSWWLVDVDNSFDGVVMNTSYYMGKYSFVQDGCDDSGCVLGRFTVSDSMDEIQYKIFSQNSFGSYANISGRGGIVKIYDDSKSGLFDYGDLFYYEGDFLNNISKTHVLN